MSGPIEVWHAMGGKLRSYGKPDKIAIPPWVPKFPGEPPPGKMYNGMGIELAFTTFAAVEAANGIKIGSTRRYYSSSQVATLCADAATDVAAHRLSWPSITLPLSWGQMAAGAQDSFFVSLATGIAAVPGPVWLCLHHEPKGDGQPIEDYVAMYAHAAPILKTAANLAIAPILNGYGFGAFGGPEDPHDWYIDSADVIGFDQYNQWWTYDHANTVGIDGSAQTYRPWLEPDKVLYPLATIKTWGKPSAVGEYGVHFAWNEPGKAKLWMETAYQYALDNGCLSLNYFHKNYPLSPSPRGGWKLDDYQKPPTPPNGSGGGTWTTIPNSERMDQFKINDKRVENYVLP